MIDAVLNRVTMYRLTLYYLVALIVAAIVFASFGVIAMEPLVIGIYTLTALAVSWLTNTVFAAVYKLPLNIESGHITALILALIFSPMGLGNSGAIGAFIFACVWANASKFIFAFGGKHVFNPAAFGAAAAALLLNDSASWWAAGNVPLLPLVAIGGLLVTRKLQRFDLVLAYFAAAVAASAVMTRGENLLGEVEQLLLYSPLAFVGFIMLTEPLTTPPTRAMRILYGVIVGALSGPNVHIGGVPVTPELALLIGNVFAFLVSPKRRYALALQRIDEVARGIYDFVFISDRPLAFKAGQYLEWTLAVKPGDARGNRRYFTVASAPADKDVRLGVRFYPNSSAFKQAMGALQPGDTVYAGQVAGDFILPKDAKQKLAFLAGGIGVTPFRAMIEQLLADKQARPITLLYGSERQADVAYRDLFERAGAEIGLKTVYVLAGEQVLGRGNAHGLIDAKLIAAEIPDYRERLFYVAGPRGMVVATRAALRAMGVPAARIKVDFFPGFA
ncbi:MAG: RnfABCDGE type electron transport complex subunit D [Bauldia sp.]